MLRVKLCCEIGVCYSVLNPAGLFFNTVHRLPANGGGIYSGQIYADRGE